RAPAPVGAGRNPHQDGKRVTRVIVAKQIKTSREGVVHYLVAGCHLPEGDGRGADPQVIDVPPAGTLFINDPNNRYYQGINPGGGPQGTPGTIVPFSDSQNRVESVSFPASEGTGVPVSERAERGVYLVICNVSGHFLDVIFAFVKWESAISPEEPGEWRVHEVAPLSISLTAVWSPHPRARPAPGWERTPWHAT